MPKIDFKKELKHLYRPTAKQFEVVDIPEMNFLMVDGHGNPNTAQTYKEAIEALYAVAYKLKFLSKWGRRCREFMYFSIRKFFLK